MAKGDITVNLTGEPEVLEAFAYTTQRLKAAEDRLRELEAQQAASDVRSAAQTLVDAYNNQRSDGEKDAAWTALARSLTHPSAAAVTEPVSNAYTLPSTVQAVVDAAVAYEQWQGKWYDYTVASGEKPAKQQRALIEAVRKHRAALTAASEGASA